MDYLTAPERTRLTECETVIQHGLQTFIEVGNALMEIRESRLYRIEYKTFEEYCTEKWGMARRQADRLISAAETVEILRPIGLIPDSESQARPLTDLTPDDQRVVWQKAVETAPNGKPTAAHVTATKREFQGAAAPPAAAPTSTPPAPRNLTLDEAKGLIWRVLNHHVPLKGNEAPANHAARQQGWLSEAIKWGDYDIFRQAVNPGCIVTDNRAKHAAILVEDELARRIDILPKPTPTTPAAPSTTQPRELKPDEAAAVIWRAVKYHAPFRDNDTPVQVASKQLAWLTSITIDSYNLFRYMLQPGVIFTDQEIDDCKAQVEEELEKRIAKKETGDGRQETRDKRQETRDGRHEAVTDLVSDASLSDVSLSPDSLSPADSNEWYTPGDFIEIARRVLVAIDLDPASCAEANQVVKASEYFDKDDDGLSLPWELDGIPSRVWLNPPYANPLPWIQKLLSEYDAGNITEALVLLNTANSPQWAQLLWQSGHRVCLLNTRIKFWRADQPGGKGGDRDQMLWYIGTREGEFEEEFGEFGAVR